MGFLNTLKIGRVALMLFSGSPLFASPVWVAQPEYQPGDVILVDERGLSTYQDSTRYELSAPRGDTQVRTYCRSGSVDASCREDARNLLKQYAVQQGSNLAVIVEESILESNPPQYGLSAVLYRIQSLP
jgi:hypothetical protein